MKDNKGRACWVHFYDSGVFLIEGRRVGTIVERFS